MVERLRKERSFSPSRWLPLAANPFFMTYGDGMSNCDVNAAAAFQRKHGGIATLTALQPTRRFGELDLEDNLANDLEKSPSGNSGKSGAASSRNSHPKMSARKLLQLAPDSV